MITVTDQSEDVDYIVVCHLEGKSYFSIAVTEDKQYALMRVKQLREGHPDGKYHIMERRTTHRVLCGDCGCS